MKNLEREKLILENLKIVEEVIENEFNYSDVELIEEGNIALIEAVDSFDSSSNVDFHVFLYNYIKKVLMYYKKSSIFGVSVDESSNYLIIKKIIADYYKQNGCFPTIEEINSISGLCINDIKDAINCYQLLSLEKIDKEKSYYDYELPILDREEAQEFCEFCINNLTPEEAWYVEYMYGFFDNVQKTIKETANHFYKNEDYVESKINKSLKKMRNFYKKIL